MTATDAGQAKRKQSSLAKSSTENLSSSSLPTSLTKRPRSDSVDSKTSSWFQRLYPNSSTTHLIDRTSAGDDPMSGASRNEHSSEAPTTPEGAGDGDDGDSNNNNSSSKSHPQQAAGGIWTWLGYTNASATEHKLEDLASKQEQQQQQPQQSDDDTDMQQRSPSPEPAEARQEVSVKSSSWRLFFWPTSDQRDSVVVERNSSVESEASPPPIPSSPPTSPAPAASKPAKQPARPAQPNMVLPPVHPASLEDQQQQQQQSTQQGDGNASLLNKALRVINSMFTQYPTSPSSSSRVNSRFAKFVHAMQSRPEDIAGKKFVIIGVHGWFPTKLVRSVVGEPTGTSIKFCEQMVAGMKQYFKDTHGLTVPHHSITSIPLEGEGKVGERVDLLYRNLVNNPAWISALATADVVFWATHSQGTPVSAILLQRLLEQGIIHQPVCFLAMAGISHGPFPTLKGNMIVKYFEADAARELFEFMDSSSAVSQRYRQSLAYLLRNGVKTVLIGSMQDQVVPLYSAIMAGASHPNILRAMYIDGHVYSKDDFLINLIIFALRLRNAGLSDHGLLTHLSEVLAGDLYSWEGGHSTVYEETGVFSIAVQYMFEGHTATAASTVSKASATDDDSVLLDPFEAKLRLNPFYLPWAMRGICDDAKVLGDAIFSRELEKLRAMFERWKPSSSKLREVKFRLEPLKARL